MTGSRLRLAAISDIHGNRSALDAVLRDIRRRGVDAIMNLGDCVSGPLDARGTADSLMELDLATVRGNHDRQVIGSSRADMGASDRAAAEQLSPEHVAWLGSLPVSANVEGVLLCHGTPVRDDVYLLEEIHKGRLHLASDVDIRSRLGDVASDIVLCGHSHVARVVRCDGRTVVNPGSVGLQAYTDDGALPHVSEAGSPHARYAILERAGRTWDVELLAVEYDWIAAAGCARAAGRVDWERALLTGRA